MGYDVTADVEGSLPKKRIAKDSVHEENKRVGCYAVHACRKPRTALKRMMEAILHGHVHRAREYVLQQPSPNQSAL